MTSRPKKTEQSLRFLPSFLTGGKNRALEQEKSRLVAFLDAVPAEYCGWSSEGALLFSDGFCRMLGIKTLQNIADIENALYPGDAAALEGLFIRLQEQKTPFAITVRSADARQTFRLSGRIGQDPDNKQSYDILWLEDITEEKDRQDTLRDETARIRGERDRLEKSLENLPLPLWLRDDKFDLIWCNKLYATMTGMTPAAVVAEQKELPVKPVKAGKIEHIVQPGPDLAQKAVDENKKQELCLHVISGGKRLFMKVSETPLPQIGMTIGMAEDITREEELETEQKRYIAANMDLLEQLGSAIGIYSADHRIEFYNAAFARLWGLEERWLDSHPKLGDIMEKLRETRRLPEQADFRHFKRSWLDMFTNLVDPYEDMLYLPDGSTLRMLVVPHPMGGLMMTFEDVSSRLELESSYNTLIAVQKETLDNLTEGVAVFGGDGRLKLWNPSFAQLWGLHPESLEGEPHITKLADKMKPYFEPDEWQERRDELITQSLDRNIHEGRMKRADKSLIAFSTVPLPDGGVLVTHVDVTDTVRVENALREKNIALETAERLKLDFLANVSYQLRTPLNAIMGFSEILEQEYFGTLNEKQKEYTHGIGEAGERLLSLVNDILDLSTIEAGYMTLQKDEFSVSEMLAALHDLTSDWARKEKLEVKLECPKNIGRLYADERRIKQVLLNLVRNAISYTPKGGLITLSAKRRKEALDFYIKDTGRGIEKEDQLRIFEPFERARGQLSGESRMGAGLGLTLVKNIVALHGGTVTLESESGKGTLVTVTLPLPKKAPIRTAPKKKAKA